MLDDFHQLYTWSRVQALPSNGLVPTATSALDYGVTRLCACLHGDPDVTNTHQQGRRVSYDQYSIRPSEMAASAHYSGNYCTPTVLVPQILPLLVVPIYGKRFPRHYSGRPALLNRYYCGMTTVPATHPWAKLADTDISCANTCAICHQE